MAYMLDTFDSMREEEVSVELLEERSVEELHLKCGETMIIIQMIKRKKLTELMRRMIARQQDWRCAMCLELLDASFDIDHIIALCNNGEDKVGNMQALCANCHRKKTNFNDLAKRHNTYEVIQEILSKKKPISLQQHFDQFKYKKS